MSFGILFVFFLRDLQGGGRHQAQGTTWKIDESPQMEKELLPPSAISQLYMRAGDDYDKYEKLRKLFASLEVGQSVIFMNWKKKAWDLAKWLVGIVF